MIGGVYNEIGLLFETDHRDTLMKWCRENPKIAPERLMDMAPVFEGDSFSKIVCSLLDEFGWDTKVLKALSHNMGCFGWIGSPVILYKKQLAAVEKVKGHRYEEVREWSEKMSVYLMGEIEAEEKKGN